MNTNLTTCPVFLVRWVCLDNSCFSWQYDFRKGLNSSEPPTSPDFHLEFCIHPILRLQDRCKHLWEPPCTARFNLPSLFCLQPNNPWGTTLLWAQTEPAKWSREKKPADVCSRLQRRSVSTNIMRGRKSCWCSCLKRNNGLWWCSSKCPRCISTGDCE